MPELHEEAEDTDETALELLIKKQHHRVKIDGDILFENVHFRYPTAPSSQPDTLQGISFKIQAGTVTSLVGPSGSGKSTVV